MSKVRSKSKEKKAGKSDFRLINPNAAGIDIGSKEHYVAVPKDRAKKNVRVFACFTPDLYQMADWLEECGIQTVVMESTGVYWIPVFQVLEDRGFDVKLVDARHARNVPGRKSDVMDCQWLQELHSYGLLSGAFIPDKETSVLRTLWRHRSGLVEACARNIHLMQKSLELMSLHLHKVLSDITGQTGLKIIRAIVQGEKDPYKLAQLKNRQVKASEGQIVKSLTGHYREEHLFTLKQALASYDFHQNQLQDLDHQVEAQLSKFADKSDSSPSKPPLPKISRRKNEPYFDVKSELHRICGVDLTKIDGLDSLTLLTIIAEVGVDMCRFETEKHFSSYLGLCPNNRKTGGKIKGSKSRPVTSKAAQAFRLGAQSLHRSKSALGAYYRRMRYRLGAPKAITATAHKLCRIFYRLLKFGEDYVDIGMEAYEQQYEAKALANLNKRAKSMGYVLVAAETGLVVS